MYQFDNLTNCAERRSSKAKSPKPDFRPAIDHNHSESHVWRFVAKPAKFHPTTGEKETAAIRFDGTAEEYGRYSVDGFIIGGLLLDCPADFERIPDQSAIRAAWAELTTPEQTETVVSVEDW